MVALTFAANPIQFRIGNVAGVLSKVEFAWVGFEAYKSNPKIPHTTGANKRGMSAAVDCVSTTIDSASKPKIDPIAPKRVTFIFDSVTFLFM